ncbi:MAG: CDP-2,3-bis-(O-geranylgeranyl)-sn-glycerol synthase [Candidatus Diapherotrites archaeon]|nr:CDP-2,3-bis-(O-geranylgeranyl)-sn-glycerol synthase [Candidatus Diapherotrites archaeon]
MESLNLIHILLYIMPFYVANSTAMLFGGKTPLDLGKMLSDGKRLLGDGKTFKGTLAGLFLGLLTSLVIAGLFPSYTAELTSSYVLLGFLVSFGALLGDITASFFKRRSRIERGTEVLLLDQLDFVFGALIVGSFIYIPSFYEILFISILTLFVHKASNWIAFKFKLKKVPW